MQPHPRQMASILIKADLIRGRQPTIMPLSLSLMVHLHRSALHVPHGKVVDKELLNWQVEVNYSTQFYNIFSPSVPRRTYRETPRAGSLDSARRSRKTSSTSLSRQNGFRNFKNRTGVDGNGDVYLDIPAPSGGAQILQAPQWYVEDRGQVSEVKSRSNKIGAGRNVHLAKCGKRREHSDLHRFCYTYI